MSGRARRKAVSQYIQYTRRTTKDSSFNKAKRFAKCMMEIKRRYSHLSKFLTRENFLLERLKNRESPPLRIITIPLVFEEREIENAH